MNMAQGDPYSPSEMTGDADPTMINPKAHSTTTRKAMAGAVPSLEAQLPSRVRDRVPLVGMAIGGAAGVAAVVGRAGQGDLSVRRWGRASTEVRPTGRAGEGLVTVAVAAVALEG
jgi:hypothetical protein